MSRSGGARARQQRDEELVDRRANARQLRDQGALVLVPQGASEPRERVGVGRQEVGLDPAPPLHAVLQAAQTQVAFAEPPRLAIAHEPAAPEAGEGRQRAGHAQGRFSSAPEELQRLHEELRLADPPRTELEVSFRIGRELRARALDELVERSSDRGIRLAPVDERRDHLAQHRGAELRIARGRPSAQQRRALPEASPGLVVALGRGQGVDERPSAAFRTQPQIDAPDHAVGGRLSDARDGAVHHA